jgi:hypothetical protein
LGIDVDAEDDGDDERAEGEDQYERPYGAGPVRGHACLGHYLELGSDVILTPAEMFASTPPKSLALLACWGARVPGQSSGDPLTLATIALARGSRQILVT